MEGVFAVLDGMSAPFGLATSSSPQRLALSLSVTGLARYFDGRCTTASEVTRGKPEPDLFLYTASKLGFTPAECLVIEDSEMGIRAAQAAGMVVWHFAGGSHVKGGYGLAPDLMPDLVVPDMAALQAALAAAGLCRAANAS